jgi:hypothetical protein
MNPIGQLANLLFASALCGLLVVLAGMFAKAMTILFLWGFELFG